ncbi:MAG: hypothetical protein VKK98_00435 [Cyanobacteriota bacterium]|nr:hypothetical protein [Cyanobacteriota bacterium]
MRLKPCSNDPIAIRTAVDRGWQAYRSNAWVFSGFTLLAGGMNLLTQLGFRHASAALISTAGDAQPLAIAQAGAFLAGWGLSGLWLLVGLMQGAATALDGRALEGWRLLRPDWPSMARCGGTIAMIAAVLWGVRELADASAALLALLQPWLAPLPLLARLAVLVYVAADQVLWLPITVLGRASPWAALQSGRRAIDPHWLQALGLLSLVSLMILAGVLLLLVGLVVMLPLALCSLAAAYGQLFVPHGQRISR